MNRKIAEILYTGIFLIILDAIYLSFVYKWFNNIIVGIQGKSMIPRVFTTIICYFVLILGLWYFIIREHRPIADAFLLGILVYSVYELTNISTIRNWSPNFALIDTLWGGTLFATVTYIVYRITKNF